jgi:soluble lytic murein transglycosylase-like protein
VILRAAWAAPIVLALGACAMVVPADRSAPQSAAVAARSTQWEELSRLRDRERRAVELRRHMATQWPHIATDEAALDRLSRWIVESADSHDIDPWLLASVMAVESNFRADAVSAAGAVGLMQVRPFVGAAVALRHDELWLGDRTLSDPRSNVRIGAAYFGELLRTYDGDLRLALAAYNIGPGLLDARLASGWQPNGPYVRKVLSVYSELKARALAERAFADRIPS